MLDAGVPQEHDGRRIRGDASRRAIVAAAAQQASVTGLGSLSIAALAAEVSMSKAGVAALFGTKERLQLATIEEASRIFRETVIAPTLAKAGVARLKALAAAWLTYSRTRVFRGGCFFAATTVELASTPGPLRDALAASMDEWHAFLGRTAEKAIELGELPPATELRLLVFQLTALLDAANTASLLHGTAAPYRLARQAIDALLAPA